MQKKRRGVSFETPRRFALNDRTFYLKRRRVFDEMPPRLFCHIAMRKPRHSN